MSNRPIEHCYWVSPDKLLAGEYPRLEYEERSSGKIQQLVDAGVSAFVDLTQEEELLPYTQFLGSVSYQRFPIQDQSIPQAHEQMRMILDVIDQLISDGNTVYLHCWGGIGRTGTVVGCWLSRHGYPGVAAFDQLQVLWRACPKSEWRDSPETAEQVQYIHHWHED